MYSLKKIKNKRVFHQVKTWNCSIQKNEESDFIGLFCVMFSPDVIWNLNEQWHKWVLIFERTLTKFWKSFVWKKNNTFAYSIKKLPWKFIAETNRKKTFGCIGKSFNNCQVPRQISMAESPKCMHSTTKPLIDLLMSAFFQFQIIFC